MRRPWGPVFIACHVPPLRGAAGEDLFMSRMQKRNSRSPQRRNEGPEMVSQAADDRLQKSAQDVVRLLYKAAMDDNLKAAQMLVELADAAEYPEQAALLRKLSSLAERWASEPQVALLETAPQLGAGTAAKLLTSGE